MKSGLPNSSKDKRKKKKFKSLHTVEAVNNDQHHSDTHVDETPLDPQGGQKSELTTGAPDIHKRDLLISPMKVEVPANVERKGSLDSLLMRTGSLDKLLPKDKNTWPTIAKGLKNVFLDYQRERPDNEKADYTADLCTVYYPQQGQRTIKKEKDAQWCKGNEVSDTVDFLETFMNANGQWDYIRKQDWFNSGDYVIGIDVNYYPDRSGYKDSPVFHKDTGGNNIFVNLVFDNTEPIESTEWFADLQQPSKRRLDWQHTLLPPDYLKELDLSRASLKATYPDDAPVAGGVSKMTNTYVSWTDDLVWHATPVVDKRLELTAKDVEGEYHELDKVSGKRDFAYASENLGRKVYGVELLGSIAEAKDTRLSRWLEEQGKGGEGIDVGLAKQAWQQVYSSENPDGAQVFAEDTKKRGTLATGWRITGESSEAIAPDKRLGNKHSVRESPTTLSTRRRVNSLDSTEVRQVRAANEGKERSFLRTWVRILRKDNKELEGLKF